MERELMVIKSAQGKYTDLIDSIRIRQHNFKNHISAILATHYTYKTYDTLVRAQNKYCDKLMVENQYNNLLLIGNRVLTAFLYEKFQEIERCGIKIQYKIMVHLENCSVQDYYLIEIVGILLDNAVESIKTTNNSNIIEVIIFEKQNKYIFSVRNQSEYISFERIEQMFQMGTSSKGTNRGLGLFHVKMLCQELDCDIYCRNIEIKNSNWIEFMLEIRKADSD